MSEFLLNKEWKLHGYNFFYTSNIKKYQLHNDKVHVLAKYWNFKIVVGSMIEVWGY